MKITSQLGQSNNLTDSDSHRDIYVYVTWTYNKPHLRNFSFVVFLSAHSRCVNCPGVSTARSSKETKDDEVEIGEGPVGLSFCNDS